VISRIFNLRHLGKELIWVGLGQALIAVGSLVGVRLLTEKLAPGAFGELSLAMTAFTLLQQLVIGPFGGSLLRFYSIALEQNELTSFFRFFVWLAERTQLGILILGSAGALLLTLLGQPVIAGLTLASTLFSMIYGTNNLLDSIQTAARRRSVVALHQGASQWLRFIAAVAMIALLGSSSAIAMWGYALSALMVLCSQVAFLSRIVPAGQTLAGLARRSAPGPWLARAFTYASPSITWGIFTWAQMTSDRWALSAFTSTQEVGYFSALYQLGYYPVLLLSNVVTQFIQPLLFRIAGDGTDPLRRQAAHQRVRLLVAGALVGTACLTTAAFFLHGPLFGLLVSAEYRHVSGYFPWMVLSSGLMVSGQMASLQLMSNLDPKKLLLPKITTAVLGTGLHFLGAFLNGLAGVVYVKSLFSLVYLLWMLWLNQRDTAKKD
jgi:O-antigen/teichoic acid export membrane protein